MANATQATRTKVVEVEEPDGVNLHLTDEEARVLRFVLGRVGGMPNGPRGKAQAIFDALGIAGVPWRYDPSDYRVSGHLSLD